MTSFAIACRNGNFDEVRNVLEMFDRNKARLLEITEANGWDCLHWAAWHSNIEFMRYLLTLEELDISAKDSSGRTALFIAMVPRTDRIFLNERERICHRREPSFEILEMLIEQNNDIMSCYDGPSERIAVALMCHHFDVVKLIIDCGGLVGDDIGNFWHVAARFQRVDCMRYLLYDTDYDPKIRDSMGKQAYYIYFQKLLRDEVEPLEEEIDFGIELLLMTCESPAETVEVYALLLESYACKGLNNSAYIIFMEIVKCLLPRHPRKHLVDKILKARLPGNYGLITLALLSITKYSIDNCELVQSVKDAHRRYLENLKFHFLQELYTLYLADESFFNEYVAEIVKIGWTFNRIEPMALFCITLSKITLAKETLIQTVFDFTKSLMLQEFNLMSMLQAPPSQSRLRSQTIMKCMGDYLLNVFVPLSNFVNAPIELLRIFASEKNDCHYNFNESENCIDDYDKLSKKKSNQFEIVSLKNLSRMSVRKYIFDNFTHSEALSKIYLLDIPLQLKQFLCYNHSNLKF